MSILITGMEMPPNCFLCKLSFMSGERLFCSAMKNEEVLRAKIDSNCPLIEIQPHGRLIDADALMHEFEKAQRTMEQHGQEYSCSFMSSSQELSTEWYCVEDMLENAPTIIPAEEGET